jgi:hypothetical protein
MKYCKLSPCSQPIIGSRSHDGRMYDAASDFVARDSTMIFDFTEADSSMESIAGRLSASCYCNVAGPIGTVV